MPLQETIDTRGRSVEDVDRGGQLAPDWYFARIADVYEDRRDGSTVLDFKIVGGPFDGSGSNIKLFEPDPGASEAERRRTMQRRQTWAYRVGLIRKDQIGQAVPIDWTKCLGQTVFLKIEEQREKDRATGRETGRVFTRPGYLGAYPLDHHEVPADVRARLLAQMQGQAGMAPSAPGGNGPVVTPFDQPSPATHIAGLGRSPTMFAPATAPANPDDDLSDL